MGDIEALMTELYFSDQATFAGRRCNTAPEDMERDEYGRPTDPACRDLNPGAWHTAVVGLLNRGATPLFDTKDLDIQFPAFIIDHTYDYEVWNYPVKRFRINSDVQVTASQANTLISASGSEYKFNNQATKFRHVKMSYWMISDGVAFSKMKLRAGERGIAPVKVDLHYVLELKDDDTIIGGEWVDTPSAPGPDSKKPSKVCSTALTTRQLVRRLALVATPAGLIGAAAAKMATVHSPSRFHFARQSKSAPFQSDSVACSFSSTALWT